MKATLGPHPDPPADFASRALPLKHYRRAWALAIHDHPTKPDGIVYTARHDPSRLCAAVFERVKPHLSVEPLGSLTDATHERLLARLLDTYDFGLV